MKSKRQSTKN